MDRTIALALALALLYSANGFAEQNKELEETIVSIKRLNKDLFTPKYDSSEFASLASTHAFSDISALNQALYMNDNGRRSEITVRGLGFTGGVFNPGIQPSTSVFLDGVYLPSAAFIAGSINNIATVDISTGHRQQISGKTSAIGNIRIETIAPSFSEQSVHFDIKTGTNHKQFVGAGSNWVISRKAALNAYIYDQTSNGAFENLANGDDINKIDHKGGSFKHLYQPYKDTSVTTNVFFKKDNSDWVGTGRTLSSRFTDQQAQFFNNLIPLAYAANGKTYQGAEEIYLPKELRYNKVSNDVTSKAGVDKAIVSVTYKKYWHDTMFSSTSAFVNHDQFYFIDSDNTNFNLVNQAIADNTEGYSQELKVEKRLDNAALSYGLYLYASEKQYRTTGFIGADLLYLRTIMAENEDEQEYFRGLAEEDVGRVGESAPVRSESKGREREASLYFQYQFDYNDESFFRVGANATYINKKFKRRQDGFCSYDTANLPKDECTATKALVLDKYYFDGSTNRSDRIITAFALRQWSFGERVKFGVGGGFHKKPGGYNYMRSVGQGSDYADSINELEFFPEKTYSLDATLGYGFNNGRSLGKITLYTTQIRDYQLSYYDGTQFFITNAERVRSQGMEVKVNHAIADHWQWNTSLNYNKAVYTKNENSVCPPEEYRDNNSCSYLTDAEALADGGRLYDDLSGEDIKNNPRVKFLSALTYEKELTSGIRVKASAEYNFLSKTRTTEFVHDEFKRNSVDLFNAYSNISIGRMDITFFIKNITDKKIKSGEFASPIIRAISSLPGGINTYLEPRRVWELSIRYRL